MLKLKESQNQTGDIDLTISTFKPPIFWKEKEIVKKQIQSWSEDDVKKIIYKIHDLDPLVKKHPHKSINFLPASVSNH